jgi:tetrahydromethanopterin S-methyltransferase subunit C
MFGGVGAIGFYALGTLVAATVLGLATTVTAWLSALIIAVVLGVIAGLLALQGKSKMQVATPVSEQITESVTEDVEWAKSRAQAGRQQAERQ